MDLSLVLCTRDRAHRLERTLGEMERLRCECEWELVVVDNASTDGTSGIVDEFARSAEVAVRHVREPEPGLSRARNRGCRAARGDVIALTDDDCYPEPDYLEQVTEVFRRHDVAFIGGRILLYDPADARLTVREEGTARLLPPLTFPWAGFIQGANMAFRRELFRDLGGFDERLGAGTPFPCEDIEFCARASDRGWPGGYFPGPTVHHHHGRKGEEARSLRRDYARGRGAYYLKGILDHRHTSRAALKRWYWSARHQAGEQLLTEITGAVRYGFRRLASGPRSG